jgi:hypothetical protein
MTWFLVIAVVISMIGLAFIHGLAICADDGDDE